MTIKTRLVNLRKAGERSVRRHLRYIERDGVTREGGPGQLFDSRNDDANGREFEERGREDRHQFRVIVSPEDGAEIADLRGFARDLMSQVERDLATRLDWVGVEHWDTDQPHVHLVIRGKDESGGDLVIAPEYIAHGMRARAAELATSWLGRRTELEIRQSMANEVRQERWTSLDQIIQAQAQGHAIIVRDSSATADGRFHTGLLIDRLDRLAQMGLATKIAPLHYELAPNSESVLRAMGERGDIVRTIQRAMGRKQRECAVLGSSDSAQRILGRVVSRGLADELTDREYLILDGVDGRAHYLVLPAKSELPELPAGSIVEARVGHEPRRIDRSIASHSKDGFYRTEHHLIEARAHASGQFDADAYIQSHVRRLEALRRTGIVDRLDSGTWRVPENFIAKATEYDARRTGGIRVELRSALSIEAQRNAIGSTWLDQQLVGNRESLATHGFGAEVREALHERTNFLVQHNLAVRRGHHAILARGLLAKLENLELGNLATRIEKETGLLHRPVSDGRPVAGVYSRAFNLVSGRFAMLEDGTGFSLVPWRPVIEKRIGQSISAVVRGQFVSWELARQQGLTR